MSTDVMFWEFQPGLAFAGQATYEMLCDEIEVEGLQDIDVGAYLTRIATAYPTATRFKDTQISFDGFSWKFQITWSKQHLHLTFYGAPPFADGDLFGQIADELGWWTYHPTSGELFPPEGTPAADTSTPHEGFEASLKTALQLFNEETFDSVKITSVGEFNLGDRISHHTFGSGTIFLFQKMETGTLAVVNFDQVGRKGLLLSVARLQRL